MPATPVPGSMMQVDIPQEIYASLGGPDRSQTPTRLAGFVQASVNAHTALTPVPVNQEREKYQGMFYDGIAGPLSAGRIVCAEGATGIGKGRVLARLARERLDAGFGPVVVAAPSIAVLKQLLDEWFKAGFSAASVSCVLGKQQFIDSVALQELLDSTEANPVQDALDSPTRKAVLKWISKGCLPVPKNEASRVIFRVAPHAAALEADLFHLAPELEPYAGYFRLDEFSSPDGAGIEAYARMREDAEDAGVLFCTHAMLAYDLLLRNKRKRDEDTAPASGILPDYKTLLVDEAHLLERNISAVNTHAVSIHSLRLALLHTKSGNQAARERCIKLCDTLMAKSAECGMDRSKIYYSSDFKDGAKYPISYEEKGIFDSVRLLRDQLAGMLAKSRSKDLQVSMMLGALHKIVGCTMGNSHGAMVMQNTPVRRWPRFTIGKKSVERETTALWTQVHGAVLVSATLSVPSSRAGQGAERGYIYELLKIPAERVYSPPAVAPGWAYNSASLHLVAEKHAARFSHPDMPEGKAPDTLKYQQGKLDWQNSVAKEILKIGTSSAGGTLVLCCSYEDVEKIGGLLAEFLGTRVLLKTPLASLEKQKQEFKELARSGHRPIWLAPGNAWTGLDLRDENVGDDRAADDMILTDLVIPRINFSDNQSITSLLRQRARGANFTEAAFTLRQGLGRLIRRPGLANRRIWFLDGRIWHKKSHYNVFRKILANYAGGAELAALVTTDART